MSALAAERDALAAAAADLETDRACAAHGEAVAQAEVRHLRALAEFLEARAAPPCIVAFLGGAARDIFTVTLIMSRLSCIRDSVCRGLAATVVWL